MLQIPQSLCTELTDEQASTVQGGVTLEITGIHAIEAGADTGLWWKDDDTYMTIDGKKVYGPKSFKSGTYRQVSIKRDVGIIGNVRLFDRDQVFTDDDSLGGFTVATPTNGKEKMSTTSGSGSLYHVYYKVHA